MCSGLLSLWCGVWCVTLTEEISENIRQWQHLQCQAACDTNSKWPQLGQADYAV